MQTNENTSPEFIILSEGQVIEKSLPSPLCRTCDRKNPRNSEFMYVTELIHQKPSKILHKVWKGCGSRLSICQQNSKYWDGNAI